MTLQEHIDEIRNGLNNRLFTNEASVRENIVLRVLHELGWPRYNPQVIIPEYSVEERRVDYALCHPGLKPWSSLRSNQLDKLKEQRDNCLNTLSTRECQLLSSPMVGNGTFSIRRRLQRTSGIPTESNRNGQWKVRTQQIPYDRIRTPLGQLKTTIGSSREIRQEKHGSSWWTDEFGAKVARYRGRETESLCGHRPTGEQVLDFLKSLEKVEPQVPSPWRNQR